jgi:hypothetical protein
MESHRWVAELVVLGMAPLRKAAGRQLYTALYLDDFAVVQLHFLGPLDIRRRTTSDPRQEPETG